MTVKFSKTLRREMRDDTLYDPTMTWTQEYSDAADLILADLRKRAARENVVECNVDRSKDLGISAAVYAEVWARLRRWPHSYEVDSATGKMVLDITEIDHEALRNTRVAHQTYDWGKWRVDRKDWQEMVDFGTLTPAMFEHFALMLREVLLADTWVRRR